METLFKYKINDSVVFHCPNDLELIITDIQIQKILRSIDNTVVTIKALNRTKPDNVPYYTIDIEGLDSYGFREGAFSAVEYNEIKQDEFLSLLQMVVT